MFDKSYKLLREISYVLSFLLVISVQSLLAASSGTIKGTVYDKDTKDVLPGASISIKNTTLGAASDLNGKYVIHGVPTGNQTVVISYIGYTTISIDLNVGESQEITQDVYLVAAAVQGKTVVVIGQAAGQVEAVNQQLSSNSIVNVVSAKKIQELPDVNAAEALGRLPGISVTRSGGEADKISIRGLAPQYNAVAINGITLGSTDSTNRDVDLNEISPNMIKSIEVYKAVTPDLEADAIGGFVNVTLAIAPSGFHTDLLWQSGYNKFANKYSNYKAVAAVSDRFFDDKFGGYLMLSVEQVDRSSDNLNASYGQEGVDSARGNQPHLYTSGFSLNRHFETRDRYNADLLLDYRIPDGSLMLTNFFSRLKPHTADYTTAYGTPFNGSTNNNISITASENDPTNDIITNSFEGNNDFGFMQIDYGASNNYVFNNENNNPVVNFTETGAVTIKGQGYDIPADKIVPFAPVNDTDLVLNEFDWYRNTFKNVTQAYKANVKIPFVLSSDISGFFKFGGKYAYANRAEDQTFIIIPTFYGGDTPTKNAIASLFPNVIRVGGGESGGLFPAYQFINSDPATWQNFLSDRYGDLQWTPDFGFMNSIRTALMQDTSDAAFQNLHRTLPANGAYGNLSNDYTFKEKFYASYLMSELHLGTQLMVVGGARYEDDHSNMQAYALHQANGMTYQPAANDTPRVLTSNHYWLPMVQAQYKFAGWGDVRYAFTKTLSRPPFNAMVPTVYVSNAGNYTLKNNPYLLPAYSFNHDLIMSFYSNTVGLFTVDAFYKTLHAFSYNTSYAMIPHPGAGFDSTSDPYLAKLGVTSGSISTWVNNPKPAYIKGIEGAWETRFWYLPGYLSGLVLGINYSKIYSSTLYPEINQGTVGSGKNQTKVLIPTTRGNRLVNQPSDIFNTSVGYDLGGFSARVSFVYQGNVLNYVGSTPVTDGYTQSYFRVDASVRYLLQQDSFLPGLQFYLNLNNLTARPDQGYNGWDGFTTYENFYGFTADLGVRYTL